MFSGPCVHPFTQVQEETRFALQSRQKLLRALGFYIGDPRLGFRQTLVFGFLDIADNSTVKASDAGTAKERDSLTCRDTTNETLGLDVTDERRDKTRTF